MGLFGKKKKASEQVPLAAFLKWMQERYSDEERGDLLMRMALGPEKAVRDSYGKLLSEADLAQFMIILRGLKKTAEEDRATQAMRDIVNDD